MPADVRCDLCEQAREPVWIYRTGYFAVVVGDEVTHYPEDAEWGVCTQCRLDVEADRQERIQHRRRVAATLSLAASCTTEQLDAVLEMLNMVTAAFLATRQRGYGRPFGLVDYAEATAEVIERGRRA